MARLHRTDAAALQFERSAPGIPRHSAYPRLTEGAERLNITRQGGLREARKNQRLWRVISVVAMDSGLSVLLSVALGLAVGSVFVFILFAAARRSDRAAHLAHPLG